MLILLLRTYFIAAGLLVLAAVPRADAQPVRQVLMLQAVDRGNMTIDHFTTSFRVELDQRSEKPVNVIQIMVGPSGFVGTSEQIVVDYIRSAFADRPKPDLIMTVAGPAATFARAHRQQLFPETPILFAAVDQKYLGDAPLLDNETAVSVVNDYPRTVETILQLLPQTKQIYMVMGSGQLGRFWHQQLEDQFRRFRDRVTFVWFDDLSLPEILRRSATLPDHSVIFYVTFGTDVTGAAYADDRVFADLHTEANAPLFAGHSVFMGAGILGGSLLSIDEVSRDTADVAMRLLNGVPPRDIRLSPRRPGPPVFDWRELQRWAIPENRLPPESVVRYRPPSLWSAYRGTVLGAAAVLAVQLLLIFGLLYQRRARRTAEMESKRNLALAADASRRETMSALTGSIAHELGQPLTSMLYNAQALQMMVAGNQARSDTIEEILADIQSQGVRATEIIERHRTMLRSHQLDKKTIDLHAVISESLALVAHECEARQVKAIVQVSPDVCTITGDRVLLQQVFVNLLMNAMDAMAATPPPQRRVTIRSEVGAANVVVSVCDTGAGLSPEVIDTLFTQFVTTKSHGLGIGLTIVRTILDAHGGTIAARNNPEGGATFVVTLPLSDAKV